MTETFSVLMIVGKMFTFPSATTIMQLLEVPLKEMKLRNFKGNNKVGKGLAWEKSNGIESRFDSTSVRI
jgi:hypothetical protein